MLRKMKSLLRRAKESAPQRLELLVRQKVRGRFTESRNEWSVTQDIFHGGNNSSGMILALGKNVVSVPGSEK